MASLYITEPGTYVQKKGGCLVIEKDDEIVTKLPFEEVEQVTLIRAAQPSSAVIQELLERDIPLTWMSMHGKYLGSLARVGGTHILKQCKQFELLGEEQCYLSLSKKMIAAKIDNQRTLLRRYGTALEDMPTIQVTMKHFSQAIATARNYQDVMGNEGMAGRTYFAAIGRTMPAGYTFTARSKQPPLDPFNSMIGFGYSLLFNEILNAVVGQGLHPFVGCLHRIRNGHPALVSDLIEEWRAPIVDSLVLALISRKMISLDDFNTSERGCYLTYDGQKRFLQAYHKKMSQVNTYTGRDATYRELLFKQSEQYSKTIMAGDADVYVPFKIR